MYDAVIIGAGACGLMCAVQAGLLGKKTLLIEVNNKPGAKILISGGGRCNYTNLYTDTQNFVSENPKFLNSVFAQWTIDDTIHFFEQRGIKGAEKTLGQLFPVNNKARDVVAVFTDLLQETGQDLWLNTKALAIEKSQNGFVVDLLKSDKKMSITTPKVVLATGGLPVAKLGASDFAIRIARKFGHTIVPLAPALVPLTITGKDAEWYAKLAGNTVFSKVSNKRASFKENILFTHWGLSGPAILQISSYWRPGESIFIDLLPDHDFTALLKEERDRGGKIMIGQILNNFFTKRFVESLSSFIPIDLKVASLGKKEALRIANLLHKFEVKPAGDKGYDKAEVMRGGINTNELVPHSLESKNISGLYFGGECVDITGWLGGYNFQWAWAAGYSIAQDL